MNAAFTLSSCGQAALDFAARGFHVFPVPPGTKKSHKKAEHSGGRAWGASTDPLEIARDWRRWPEANLGLVTGPKSGFFVVEADTLTGHGVDGIGHLAALAEEHGGWDDTIEALSPSGSWHVWFRWLEGGGVFNSEGEIAGGGIDVRGDGGMVLAPPSLKPGAAQPYRWKNPPGRFALADCPPWLLDQCRKASRKERASERLHDRLSERARETGPRIDTGGAFPFGAGDCQRVLDQLARAANTLSRPDWVRLCYGLKAGLGEAARDGWLEFSARWPGEQKPGDAEHTWDTADPDGSVGLGTVMHLLRPAAGARGGQGADYGTGRAEGAASDSDGGPPPPGADELDLSHDALARDLGARSWDQNARHVADWGQWLFWDGARWSRDKSLEHMTRARAYLGARG